VTLQINDSNHGFVSVTTDWGDGEKDQNAPPQSTAHHYSTPGTKTITITATDSSGKQVQQFQSVTVE